jgi:hypothetical protein
MTRDEADKIIRGAWVFNLGRGTAHIDPDALLKTFIALGMLKLEEPKSARDRFIKAMLDSGYGSSSLGMEDALAAFDDATS